MLITTNNNVDTPVRNVPPVGLLDDFQRDDGWPGDRPSSCGNMWEYCWPTGPQSAAYLKNGAWTGTPGTNNRPYGALYLGPGAQAVDFIITNSPASAGNQAFWVIGLGSDIGNKQIQFEVSQSNSYIVCPPGNTIVTGPGPGYIYGATQRWYFSISTGGGLTTYLAESSNLDGSGRTTIFTGTTGLVLADGPYMYIDAAQQSDYFKVESISRF